jgi:hypothetical protein
MKNIRNFGGRQGQGQQSLRDPHDSARLVQDEQALLKPKPPRRSYRISTYITEDNGALLEDMRRLIRKETGRNPKIAEVIEIALQALEKEKMGGEEY